MKKSLLILVFFTLTLCLGMKDSRATPIMIEIQELDFDKIIPVSGRCSMNYSTGAVTNTSGSKMCNNSPVGQPGHYRLLVTTNTNYDIMLRRRTPVGGDGFTFIPQGKLISDAETLDIIVDQFVTINSGALGEINIQFGGEFTAAVKPDGSRTYRLPDAVIITYQQTP